MRTKSTRSRRKSIRNLNFYLYVLQEIKQYGRLPKGKRQNINHYVKLLKSLNMIVKVGYGTWEITPKGVHFLSEKKDVKAKASTCHKPLLLDDKLKIDFCARVKIPIVKTLGNKFDFDLKKRTGEYQFLKIPVYDIGLTVQKTTAGNLIVYIHHKELEKPEDLEIMIRRVVRWTKEYYSSNRILLLNDAGATTSYLKYGILDPINKFAIPDKTTEKIKLGRDAVKILPKDKPREATISFDKTPEDKTLHTNDKTFVNRYMTMAERLAAVEGHLIKQSEHQITQTGIMNQFSHDLQLHLGAIQDLKSGTNELRDAVVEMKNVLSSINEVVKTTLKDR